MDVGAVNETEPDALRLAVVVACLSVCFANC